MTRHTQTQPTEKALLRRGLYDFHYSRERRQHVDIGPGWGQCVGRIPDGNKSGLSSAARYPTRDNKGSASTSNPTPEVRDNV